MISEPSGALVVRTGKRTDHSLKDRFVVENAATKEAVAWGAVNKPFPNDAFEAILAKAVAYVVNLEEVFVVDRPVRASGSYRPASRTGPGVEPPATSPHPRPAPASRTPTVRQAQEPEASARRREGADFTFIVRSPWRREYAFSEVRVQDAA